MSTVHRDHPFLLRKSWRAGVAALAALGLSFTLVACSSDDSPDPADAPDADIEVSDDDSDMTDDEGEELDDELESALEDMQPTSAEPPSDFPVPDEYTLLTGGGERGGWTGVLGDIPDSIEEVGAFYERELTAAGWELSPDATFIATEDDIGFAGKKEGWELQMGIFEESGSTSVMANVIPTE